MKVWPAEVLFEAFRAFFRIATAVGERLPGRQGRQRRHVREQIIRSGLFDADWYRGSYPDVATAGADPLTHYLSVGWKEGRDPGPHFATSAYVRAYDDVAASGINPLWHFIVFGLEEGRNSFGSRHLPASFDIPALTELPEASECLSLPQSPPTSLNWLRIGQLDDSDPRLVELDGAPVGYAADAETRAAILSSFDALRFISGEVEASPTAPSVPGSLALSDAWFVSNSQVRTRWIASEEPVVVRAWQCDPFDGGQIKLLGEGPVVHALDTVDFTLVNPWYPLLVTSSDLDGLVRECRLIGFPSLFRGGQHYPELLWNCENNGRFDPGAVDRDLIDRLFGLLAGEAVRSIAAISIDWSMADGNGAISQADFQLWLQRVVRLKLIGDTEAPSAPGPSQLRSDGGGVLHLPPNAIPTIAGLLAMAGASARTPRTSMLIARLDPSEPVLLLQAPPVPPMAAASHVPLDAKWARTSASPVDDYPTFISRSRSERISDAELLIPVAADGMGGLSHDRQAISWIVDASHWSGAALWEAARSASLQRGSAKDALLLIGASDPAVITKASRAFAGAIEVHSSLDDALAALATPLAAFIAPGVVMHNEATAGLFAAMLGDQTTATASCVMISASRKAGIIKAEIVDPGAILANDSRRAGASDARRAATELWRTTYSVAEPSNLLWACRSEDARQWSRQQGQGDSVIRGHLCSALVTASATRRRSERDQDIAVPLSDGLRVGWLVG